jgi:transcriptional regulator with XRE-family HTH domain
MSKSEILRKKISEILKASRRQSQLSQQDVVDKLPNISPDFLSNWEQGLSSPPLEVLFQLIQLYKIDHRKIIGLMIEARILGKYL